MPATRSSGTSAATTQGISVHVQAEYIPEQSSPVNQRYVFAYAVRISNVGKETAQLRTRHWIIQDATGKVEEVKGPGVVGHEPKLEPGEEFKYSSGCVLKTSRGSMHGTYQMERPDGTMLDAEIAKFELLLPMNLN